MEVDVLVLAAEVLLHAAPVVLDTATRELAVALRRHGEDVPTRLDHGLHE